MLQPIQRCRACLARQPRRFEAGPGASPTVRAFPKPQAFPVRGQRPSVEWKRSRPGIIATHVSNFNREGLAGERKLRAWEEDPRDDRRTAFPEGWALK